MTHPTLTQLATLLKARLTGDSLRALINASAELTRVKTDYRWFFFLLTKCFVPLLDDPDARDADVADVMMEEIRSAAERGVVAIERDRVSDLIDAANYLCEICCLY